MLTNNFKQLMNWYAGCTFTNVLGLTTNKITVMGAQANDLSATNQTNNNYMYGVTTYGHPQYGVAYNFEYYPSVNLSNYTAEKTSYKWINITYSSGNTTTTAKAYMRNGFTIFLGTGDTEATVNDYCLADAIKLASTGGSCTHLANGLTTVQRTFVNNTENDVTIKEIGLYMFSPNSETGKEYPIVLMGRKVLSSPITIPVGDTYVATYNIDFRNISYAEADA